MADPAEIPQYNALMWPTLKVLRQLGGSARIDEISEGVIEMMGFTVDQQAVRRRPSQLECLSFSDIPAQIPF